MSLAEHSEIHWASSPADVELAVRPAKENPIEP
jgi:hypothetical protein